MKTQTAEKVLKKQLLDLSDWDKRHVLSAMKDYANQHTTTQIEALRERLNDRFVGGDARIIDQIINNFLKEINP
jgi:hypothetical protein